MTATVPSPAYKSSPVFYVKQPRETLLVPFARGHTDRQTGRQPQADQALTQVCLTTDTATVDVVALWTGSIPGQITCAFCLSFYICEMSMGTLVQTAGF